MTSTARRQQCVLAGFVGVVAVSLLVLAPGVSADPKAHPVFRDFLRSGKYDLHVEGRVQAGTRLYHSQRAAAYLVVSEAFESPILVNQRTACIETVGADSLLERDEGDVVDLQAGTTPKRAGPISLQGSSIAFTVKGAPARLQLKPPLRGSHWSSAVVDHSPDYARAARAYQPDPAALKVLAESGKEVRVQIFFGTWCAFCSRFLPHTMKVEQELKKAGANYSFEFFGLPSPPAAWLTREAQQYRVRKLPTGLIFVDDKQVGRFEGNDWIHPEISLSRVIH